jgi:thioredoxin reductase
VPFFVDEAASETSVRGLFAVGDMSRRRGDAPSLKQIYTAQEYAVRAIQAIDRRVRAARRKEILAHAAGARTT